MKIADAALTALYPVLVILGAVVGVRYAGALRTLPSDKRVMVCAMLVLVAGIMYEQTIYGLGRLTGDYIHIAMTPAAVAIGKILLAVGLCYKLYAFWLIAPQRPRVIVPMVMSACVWAAVFMALLF